MVPSGRPVSSRLHDERRRDRSGARRLEPGDLQPRSALRSQGRADGDRVLPVRRRARRDHDWDRWRRHRATLISTFSCCPRLLVHVIVFALAIVQMAPAAGAVTATAGASMMKLPVVPHRRTSCRRVDPDHSHSCRRCGYRRNEDVRLLHGRDDIRAAIHGGERPPDASRAELHAHAIECAEIGRPGLLPGGLEAPAARRPGAAT